MFATDNVTRAILGLGLLVALGCSKTSESGAQKEAVEQAAAPAPAPAPATIPVAVTADASQEAKTMFTSRCVVCHGASGKGDGPGAAALDPKPRDYTAMDWQANVTDDQLRSVIVMGGAAIGKSPIMPASPDLQSKPEVVDELVKIIRSFKHD